MYESEMLVWREKERCRIRVVQMNNHSGLLGVNRIDAMLNAWVKEFCCVKKRVYERINDSALM